MATITDPNGSVCDEADLDGLGWCYGDAVLDCAGNWTSPSGTETNVAGNQNCSYLTPVDDMGDCCGSNFAVLDCAGRYYFPNNVDGGTYTTREPPTILATAVLIAAVPIPPLAITIPKLAVKTEVALATTAVPLPASALTIPVLAVTMERFAPAAPAVAIPPLAITIPVLAVTMEVASISTILLTAVASP